MATEAWSGKHLPRVYGDATQQAQKGVSAQYKAAGKIPPNIGKMSSADFDAISILKRNLNADLTNAVNHVGRMMEDEIRKAGLQASLDKVSSAQTVKQMQNNLVQMLQDKGIAAIEYTRGGKKCYMSLKAYAELTARSTVHEARNTANINLGARIGNDLVRVSSHYGACPICTPYQGRVFSVSGTHPNYPSLYATPFSQSYQNFHPHCRHILTQYVEELRASDEVEQMREFSNRSFEVGGRGWTKEQTAQAERSLKNYRAGIDRKRKMYTDRKRWQNYRAVLGGDAPVSFSGFRRMKTTGGRNWHDLQRGYRDVNWMRRAQENKIVTDAHKIPVVSVPNSVVDVLDKNGIIESRRYYNANGNVKLDFDVTNHGNPARHKIVPHSHEWDYSKGTVKRDAVGRKPTRAELIANEDIIQ